MRALKHHVCVRVQTALQKCGKAIFSIPARDWNWNQFQYQWARTYSHRSASGVPVKRGIAKKADLVDHLAAVQDARAIVLQWKRQVQWKRVAPALARVYNKAPVDESPSTDICLGVPSCLLV